jgi:hypothetical protein
MTILYGSYQFGLKKISVRNDFCNCCQRECIAEEWKSFKCGHLFFIPILPLGPWQRWKCSHCGEDPRARYKTSKIFRILLLLILPYLTYSLWIDAKGQFRLPHDAMPYWMSAIFGVVWFYYLYTTFFKAAGPTDNERRAAVAPLRIEHCIYCYGPLTLHPHPECPSCRIRYYTEPTQRLPKSAPPPLPQTDIKRESEERMAEWLAHPNEFGVRPTTVHLKRTYHGNMAGYGDVQIHLLEYQMPDGTQGRGFINGSLTWSFLGEKVNTISDDDLLVAYCGWSFLTPALHTGDIVTQFVSEGEEARYLARKQQQGLTGVTITMRYKIGTSEVFEFTGHFQGTPARGAGDTNCEVGFLPNDPRFNLPAIYFLVGQQVIKSMR